MTQESSSSGYDDGDNFVELLRTGDPELMQWIRSRCEYVARAQFSSWAWEWIHEDFMSDLTSQLLLAVRSESFELRGVAGAYVDTAIRNLYRRYFRDMARVRQQVPVEAIDNVPSHGRDSLTQVAVAVDLKRALAQLSEQCRDLIRNKYVVGLSMNSIADQIGVEEKTVRSRLHSCRQKLRALWF